MKINCDWHLHTTHSYDCGPGKYHAGLKMSELVELAAKKGVTHLGITDHVNCPYSLLDAFESKNDFDKLPFNEGLHFGVEASCVSQWELDEMESGAQLATPRGIREGGPEDAELALSISAADKKDYAFEYVIGAVHWPMYIELTRENVIKDYHRQLMFLASHKLVDIVGHPWWWGGIKWRNEQGMCVSDPWIDDFGKIPLSMHDEFAACLKENGKAAELNIESCLLNKYYPEDFTAQYADYIAYLAERGVKISIGSDSHGPDYEPRMEEAERVLEAAGVKEEDLFSLTQRVAPKNGTDE